MILEIETADSWFEAAAEWAEDGVVVDLGVERLFVPDSEIVRLEVVEMVR